ncbi:hypothetical protein ALC56_04455 [Trachymyrmex septentrionalis]|uniref:Uncharacterized protein n=1 Tax=Trachymyrmex septentrionalis TaxID=34720 RepID=A0A195FN18_9HYME|nr:hypothetical protein ALC56_04455 [Trachymyrmex septentrionalis]
MSKVTVTYTPLIETVGFISSIICHPFRTDSLHCFINDIKHVISKGLTLDTSSRIEVGQWFEIKFKHNKRGVRNELITEGNPTKLIKNIMKHMIHQFKIGPVGDIENVNDTHEFIKYEHMGEEKTPIGQCKTAYLMQLGRFKQDAYKKTNSNFQIRLLNGRFDQTDLHIYIKKKFMDDCDYSSQFADFLGTGKVTKYEHIIKLIDNKLKFITTLEVRSSYPGNSIGRLMFKETMQLNLIDIKTRK